MFRQLPCDLTICGNLTMKDMIVGNIRGISLLIVSRNQRRDLIRSITCTYIENSVFLWQTVTKDCYMTKRPQSPKLYLDYQKSNQTCQTCGRLTNTQSTTFQPILKRTTQGIPRGFYGGPIIMGFFKKPA